MNSGLGMNWMNLLAAYAILLPVIAIAMRYRLGMVRDLLIAVARMTVQLALVGIYLRCIFLWNSWLANLAWVLIMIVAASMTSLHRSGLKARAFFPAVFASIAASALSGVFWFVILVAGATPSRAQVFIPIAGMIIGNSMRANVIALQRFESLLKERAEEFRMRLSLGATVPEAALPFFAEALKASVSPQVATMATLGIVSLPGMMTGQLLGGSTPDAAIQYQIAIMLAIVSVQMTGTALLLAWVRGKLAGDGAPVRLA